MISTSLLLHLLVILLPTIPAIAQIIAEYGKEDVDIARIVIIEVLLIILSIIIELYYKFSQLEKKIDLKNYNLESIKTFAENIKQINFEENTPHVFKTLLHRHVKEVTKTVTDCGIKSSQQQMISMDEILIKNLQEEVFLCFLGKYINNWKSSDSYFKLCRDAAKKEKEKRENGKPFVKWTRIFVCKSEDLKNPDLIKQIIEDEQSHIDCKIYNYDTNEDPNVYKDFGIWDNKIVAIVHKDLVSGYDLDSEYTTSPEKLNAYSEIKSQLIEHSISVKYALKIMNPLFKNDSEFEKLDANIENILLPYKMNNFPTLLNNCHSLYFDGDCSWYHGSWALLRVITTVCNPDSNSSFYKEKIVWFFGGINPSKKSINILISGIADHGMLSYILDSTKGIMKKDKLIINIDIIDLCNTPLEISKWYFENVFKDKNYRQDEVHINCKRENIFHVKDKNKYDLIVTDTFLTRFSDENKKKLVDHWHDILTKDGTIITTARLVRDIDKEGIPFPTESDRVMFAKKTWRHSTKYAYWIYEHFKSENIYKKALLYATKLTSYPFKTNEDIIQLFLRDNKFEIESKLSIIKIGDDDSRYALIKATKKV